jgi:hypothetical protein
VQPTGQRRGLTDRTGLLQQDQEGGLKGVFGILLVSQHAAAKPHHQGAVTADDRRHGPKVLLVRKQAQQLGVAAAV